MKVARRRGIAWGGVKYLLERGGAARPFPELHRIEPQVRAWVQDLAPIDPITKSLMQECYFAAREEYERLRLAGAPMTTEQVPDGAEQ